jgi:hypothetical protein
MIYNPRIPNYSLQNPGHTILESFQNGIFERKSEYISDLTMQEQLRLAQPYS